MLKTPYLLLIAAFLGSFVLKAEEAQANDSTGEAADTKSIVAAKEVSDSKSMETAATAEEPVAPESMTEVPDLEIIEMVGFVIAQGGGIAVLNLSDAEIAIIADALVEGLNGAKDFENISQESIQKSFVQAQARAEAIESGLEEIPSISESSLQTIGFVIAMQSRLTELGFGPKEIPLIQKGFIQGATLSEPTPEMEAKFPAFQEFMQKRVEAAKTRMAAEVEKIAAERIVAGKAFFEKLSADQAVQKSESGLYYKIIKPGSEPKPSIEDSVLVHYKGTLIDGTQFDSSYDRGSPAEFPLNGVVEGFGEGLTKIGVGGEIILYIPSELGYGNSPRPGGVIKPGDALIFKCELIDINP